MYSRVTIANTLLYISMLLRVNLKSSQYKKKKIVTLVIDVNYTCNFTIYTHIKSLCCRHKSNTMLYVNYIAMKNKNNKNLYLRGTGSAQQSHQFDLFFASPDKAEEVSVLPWKCLTGELAGERGSRRRRPTGTWCDMRS